ncbi:hypothetical protein TorRG33x02_098810 [Trema orientale]|uniref:Uncharacterized protein n=1 Tax=Trema orientale TaxID=63057 RepID=A0A2P5F9D4_TREOI|nr:hypothetical protein TorRG33x02_098810 [Trema orientale]
MFTAIASPSLNDIRTIDFDWLRQNKWKKQRFPEIGRTVAYDNEATASEEKQHTRLLKESTASTFLYGWPYQISSSTIWIWERSLCHKYRNF